MMKPQQCDYCQDWSQELFWFGWKRCCHACFMELDAGIIPGPEITASTFHVPKGVSVVRISRTPGLLKEGGLPGFQHCGGNSGSWDNAVNALED